MAERNNNNYSQNRMNKRMYILVFIGITVSGDAGLLCSATRTTSLDRCHYSQRQTERKATNSVQRMLLIGDGLILYYVC